MNRPFRRSDERVVHCRGAPGSTPSQGASYRADDEPHAHTPGPQRRDQLLAFATVCFAERDCHVTPVADIVAGLRVGKGVFYWYFASKNRLFVEILRSAQRELREAQRSAIGDERDPLRRIEAGIRATFAWAAEHPHHDDPMRMAAHEDRFRPHLRRGEAIARADLVKHIRDAMAERGVHDTDPGLVAEAILGVTQRLGRVAFRGESPSPTAAADAAVAFCLGGLLGRP